MKIMVRISRTTTGSFDYSAPNCFKNFSELALTLAGGFMLNDFLKLAIAFFESPFFGLAETVETIGTFGKRLKY